MNLKKTLTVALALIVLSIPLEAAKAKVLKKEMPITSKSKQAVELFKKGRDLLDNIRFGEAETAFKQAIELDPNFALAHAFLGNLQPGSVGEQTLLKAASLAGSASEAERVLINAMLADRQGDLARARELRENLLSIAPNDWHAHFYLAQQFNAERNWEDAARHLEHAVALNPQAGGAFNILGYTYLAQRENEKAIEAFRKYVAASPNEPNPHDSLAEALMAAGRYEEAEQAFAEALRIEPSFYNAWEGIAFTHFLRGQWEQGTEALARAEAGAPRPSDRATVRVERAWIQFARGEIPAAFQTLDALEQDAQRDQLTSYVFIPLVRAAFYNQLDRPLQALQQAETAQQRAAKFPRSTQVNAATGALRARLEAETRLGRLSDARQTLARLQELVNQYPRVPGFRGNAHYGEGLLALAAGDAKSAAAHFAQCLPQDGACGWKQFVAENMAGDRAAAEATRNRLLAGNYRDASFLSTVARLR